ncbi:MAG: glutamate-1-semialdehyde 2,1-aminomutase [Candidatus Eremiobacteraeota bacterium]|nr:glutamate-1-semialdehyde 2,1-aminomutase [Candidatus Eremiobacteraeota bacterium]MBC5828528.1 glutamate-1-semialdehyde 2,1-aminomutase [Candidatus Eremiobacteraeota bacterium]
MRPSRRSAELYEAARKLIPGGVNSPVRAFRAVGGTPLFVTRGQGSKIYDADGNEFIDYVLSWGALALGHADPDVVTAIERAAQAGTSFGAPTPGETELAAIIVEAIPSIEQVRFVNSGTEACMSALRLARAFTGRDKIVKCAGCYHGHADSLLVSAGSGALTLGVPDSPGVPASFAEHTIVIPYNDGEAAHAACRRYADEIACVIVEPLAGNMGFVRAKPQYLQELRDLTDRIGALLIFDEVMTGFRVAYGGAQTLLGISPDLTCLGKIIGGGLPVGAFGGKRDVMRRLAPDGDVYQAGTLSGNPLAMAVGIAQLRRLEQPGSYERLEGTARTLEAGLRKVFAAKRLPVSMDREGSMWGMFFQAGPVTDLASAKRSDLGAFRAFFNEMLARGIYLAPSAFEAAFVSTAHSKSDVERTIAAAAEAVEAMVAVAS